MAETCPVCGLPISAEVSPLEGRYKEKTLLFCSEKCLSVFREYPQVYAGEDEPELSFLEDSNL